VAMFTTNPKIIFTITSLGFFWYAPKIKEKLEKKLNTTCLTAREHAPLFCSYSPYLKLEF